MSLSWLERLKIAIGPASVDVVRMKWGWGAAVRDTSSVAYGCDCLATRNAAVISGLRSALDPVRGSGRACSIVLSNGFARYAMLPWRDEIVDTPARQAYAQGYLANAYGSTTEAWELASDRSVYGEPTVICALDRDLLAGLRGAVSDAGLRLVSVQPYFSAAFNRFRRRMVEDELWFAVTEPDRICLGRTARRSLQLLKSQRAGKNVAAELAAMIEREVLVAPRGAAEAPLYVCAPGMDASAFEPLRQRGAETYLLPVSGDVRHAMALA